MGAETSHLGMIAEKEDQSSVTQADDGAVVQTRGWVPYTHDRRKGLKDDDNEVLKGQR